jgi:hypothetical protein
MERAAQGGVERVRAEWSAVRQEHDRVAARLAEAPRQHPARYLAGQSLAGVPEELQRAGEALDRATQTRPPDEKARWAAEAEAALNRARAKVERVRSTLDRLDAAKSGYAEAAHGLAAAIEEARRTVAALEAEGYRPEHFTAAQDRLLQAERRTEEVRGLQERPGATGVPYLEIYDASREGQAQAKEATRLARGVAELRQANEARARALFDRIRTVRAQDTAARFAAARLAAYGAYAPAVANVQRGSRELDAAVEAARAAIRANGMDRQAFREAAELLAEGERRAGTAADGFARAVETERLLTAALAAMAGLREAAQDDIEDARRAIDRYDHLDQESALRLLNQATGEFRRAETVRYADPIAAAAQYRLALSLAIEARSSVRTSAPSSGGGGGGWGGGGGGGSSGGPSGGSSGGPSGGSYGGPSGGSHGRGGF